MASSNRYHLPPAALIVLVAAAALLRFAPHPENVTPIGGLALFSGAFIGGRRPWLLPLAALLAGDLAGTLYPPVVMAGVYTGFATGSEAAKWLFASGVSGDRFVAAWLVNAALFYGLSNAGMWYAYWPHSINGLAACYLNGLPYLLRTLGGDLAYGGILFTAALALHTAHERRTTDATA